MDKYLYIIPGWEDDGSQESHQKIGTLARNKGYEVIFHDVDWKKPLSKQTFVVPENAVIFGFSLGALLAWIVAQDYECEHLILASMTPRYNLTDPEIKDALVELCGKEFVEDLITNLRLENKAKRQTIMYGALEGEPADVLVSNTEHELTETYIDELGKLL